MRLVRPLALLCLSATTALAAPQTPEQMDQIQALRVHVEGLEATPQLHRDEDWQQRLFQAKYHYAVKVGQVEEGNSTYFQQMAMGVLEGLIFESGEGSEMALHSYRALGDIYAQRGRWEDASEFYRAVAVRLLGEVGDPPRRIAAVPFPELERAPIPEVIEEEELIEEEEPEEEPILMDFEIEEEPVEVDPVALERELDHALRHWNRSGNAQEAQLRAVHLQALAGKARETSAAPRAHLVLGDYHTRTEQHEQAALHYLAVLDALTDPAPEDGASGGDGD